MLCGFCKEQLDFIPWRSIGDTKQGAPIEKSSFQTFKAILPYIYLDYITLCGGEHLEIYVEYKDLKLFCFTNQDWQQTYIEQDIMRDCSVLTQGKQHFGSRGINSLIIPWSSISRRTQRDKKIRRMRHERDLGAGITLAYQEKDARIFWSLCAEENNLVDIVNHQMDNLKKIFHDMKLIILGLCIEAHNVITKDGCKSCMADSPKNIVLKIDWFEELSLIF